MSTNIPEEYTAAVTEMAQVMRNIELAVDPNQKEMLYAAIYRHYFPDASVNWKSVEFLVGTTSHKFALYGDDQGLYPCLCVSGETGQWTIGMKESVMRNPNRHHANGKED